MAFNRLIAVLSCYSLEDVAKDLTDPQIAEFHAAWTVLWHPWLLARSTGIPEWKRCDASSLDVEKALVLMPSNPPEAADAPLIERLAVQNCTIVTTGASRNDTLKNVLLSIEGISLDNLQPKNEEGSSFSIESFEPLACSAESASVSVDLLGNPKKSIALEDFYALGLATLLVQALTRKIHYSSNLDVVLFAEQARNAAQAFIDRDPLECEKWLQSCFDQLSQERDRYFTQFAHLIDLTLLAPTTLQASLDRQLERSHPQNILASASILEKLNEINPKTLQTIRDQMATKKLTIAGGGSSMTSYDWQVQDDIYQRLALEKSKYQRLDIAPPRTFAQFEPGLSCNLPTYLKNVGYEGVLLHAFSDTSYPVPTQSKIAWESSDSKVIDALASGFVDASLPRSIFSIIADLGKQFDYHQIPTMVFAHWPGRGCDAFDDLINATRRTSALGQWTTFDNYFATTGTPYSNQRFTATQFALPIPKTRQEYRESTNRLGQMQKETFRLETTQNIASLTDLISRGKTDHSKSIETLVSQRISNNSSNDPSTSEQGLQPSIHEENLMDKLTTKRDAIGESLASSMPRLSSELKNQSGLLLINPFSGPQRVYLKGIQGDHGCEDIGRIYAAQVYSGGTDMIADIPPMGTLQLTDARISTSSGNSLAKSKSANGPFIGSSSWLLANEFIECQIDPKSGYLRSLMVSRKRGGKLSGMPAVAIESSSISSKAQYAVPANVTNQYIVNTPLRATIQSKGELVLEGTKYATFSVEYSLWRGARHVDISISYKLDSKIEIANSDTLWHVAPVWRTAWPNATTTIATWLQGVRMKAQSPKSNGGNLFMPELIELDDAEHRLYITANGAPLHRRIDSMFLETLIPTSDSKEASHQFRLGMDWPRPYQTFLEAIDSPWIINDSLGAIQSGGSLWMAQSNQANVRFTCYQLLVNSDSKPYGLRVKIQETLGKSTTSKLAFYRDVVQASKVQIDGTITESLTVESGEVVVPVTAYECSFIDVHFG